MKKLSHQPSNAPPPHFALDDADAAFAEVALQLKAKASRDRQPLIVEQRPGHASQDEDERSTPEAA
jgi:hypothetical protein